MTPREMQAKAQRNRRYDRALIERNDVAWLLTERRLRQRVIADAEALIAHCCRERAAAADTTHGCPIHSRLATRERFADVDVGNETTKGAG